MNNPAGVNKPGILIKFRQLFGNIGRLSSDLDESNQKRLNKMLIFYWGLFGLVVSFVILLFVLISQGKLGYMPTFEELENPINNLASEIYSADGELLGKYYIENRSNVNFKDLDTNLVNALIATEDIRFYSHSGIDMKAFARAVYGVLSGSSKGGGSTITQQLAKLLFHEYPETALERVRQKLNEWVIAVKLEKRYSKEEIITLYLNKFDFINNAVGIKSASKIYFNTTPDSLTLDQAALLVGMVKNPSLYNPLRRPDTVEFRRNVVLSQMYKYGFIDRATFDSVRSIPVSMASYRKQDHITGEATYFRGYLRGYLKDWCRNQFKPDGSSYDLYKDGLRIYTTINSRMQRYAEEAVKEHLAEDLQPKFFRHWRGYTHAPFVFEQNQAKQSKMLINQAMRRSERYRRMKAAGISQDSIRKAFETPTEMSVFSWKGEIDTVLTPLDSIRYYKHFLHAGVLSMEPYSGYIRAYVGGIDYKHFKYDHVIVGKRQVGSTFKPFLYTLAMQEGETPCSKVPNIQPVIMLDNGDIWEPRNTATKYLGEKITLKYALATSNNWISGHLIKRFSPGALIKIVRKMGVESQIPEVYSIALGSADLSLYEMVGAVNTFANKGVYIKPTFITRIEDKNGNVIEQFVPEETEAMNEKTAYLMVELMKGVVDYGTGIRLKLKYGFDNPIAGKTGTTNNQSDGWFMGLTPELTTGVWVGAEDRAAHFRSLALGGGSNMALPIWALYMKKVYADSTLSVGKGDFQPPIGELPEFDCEEVEEMEEDEDEQYFF